MIIIEEVEEDDDNVLSHLEIFVQQQRIKKRNDIMLLMMIMIMTMIMTLVDYTDGDDSRNDNKYDP